jgi:hypothetical protein
MEAIQKIVDHAQKIKNCEIKTVMPGKALEFSPACTVNDRIWQGDLAITIANKVPEGYELVKNPSVQLVKGNNIGAKHCLDSLDGVEMHVPKNWTEESLVGPYLKINQDRNIVHPVHGNVKVLSGTEVHCTYQREFDSELKAERRARD